MSQDQKWNRRRFLTNTAAVASTTLMPAFSFGTAKKKYQYIVVGSGAGGGTLASRLAQAGKSVLLLEAGKREVSDKYKVPAFHAHASSDPDMLWNFYVKHYSDGAKNSKQYDPKYVKDKEGILYPRGSVLGGSTAVNAMITMYPERSDWDHISNGIGFNDPSWSADAMRKYHFMLKARDFNQDTPEEEAEELLRFFRQHKRYRHGIRRKLGWLSVEQTPFSFAYPWRDRKVFRTVVSSIKALGKGAFVKEILDSPWINPNDASLIKNELEGVFNTPMATRKGVRNGSREFIQMAQANWGLKVETDALATELIFHPTDPQKVIGVKYLKGANLYSAYEGGDPAPHTEAEALLDPSYDGEVILSGGAFNSPQLLQLSGIGDEKTMQQNSITLRKHLPGVGKNLQDRYEVGVITKMHDKFKITEGCTFGAKGDPCLKKHHDYLESGKGRNAYSTNGVVIGTIKKSSPDKKSRDLYIFGLPGRFEGYEPGWAKKAYSDEHFTWAILKGHTNNKAGYVRIKSKDPRDTPEINFNYFEDGSAGYDEDVMAVVDGVKHARKINERLFGENDKEHMPGPKIKTDVDIAEFVKRNAWGHHASCSNKMGNIKLDKEAVVDNEFRVHGIKSLRVVDASVFPKIPGLFIALPTYMIAEKAADVILGQS